MNRNTFLKKLGFGVALSLSSEGIFSSCTSNMDMSVKPQTIIDGEFKTILKLPETITIPTSLTAQTLKDTLLTTNKVTVLGYGSGILGPTIRISKGSIINLNFQNMLNSGSNVHWHGLVIPASMDGGPEQMVMANSSFNYTFSVNQQAGTNWYHPHVHSLTAEQVVQGLAGLFIIESPEEKALNLPNGSYEIPLIVQDKRFNTDGTIKYQPNMMEIMTGYLGDNILVNGTSKPYLEVATRFYRFRVLNGSTARIYNLELSTGADFYIIGSDGGILSQPEKVTNSLLAPGERLDILIDFSTAKVGDIIYLNSQTFTTMGTAQGTQAFKIMSFNVSKQETDTFKLPTSLIALPKMTGSSKIRTFTLTMDMMTMSGGMHKINGKVYQADRIDETTTLGTTEIWEFDNSTGDEPHPMHIHGVQFQVVSRLGGRNQILPHEKGWKDTVLVAPREKVQVIMKFEQVGKFVFHCHNLEHEDDGMMLNYEVK